MELLENALSGVRDTPLHLCYDPVRTFLGGALVSCGIILPDKNLLENFCLKRKLLTINYSGAN